MLKSLLQMMQFIELTSLSSSIEMHALKDCTPFNIESFKQFQIQQ
jgi:hypothetical protein